MHRSLVLNGLTSHLIYSFDPKKMRAYYPVESDYVATCGVSKKLHLNMDSLEFHGCFKTEYAQLSVKSLQ